MHRSRSRAALRVAALVCLAATPLAARQAPSVPGDSAAIADSRRFIRDTMELLGAPGASITVIRNDTMIWSEGFGYADLEQRVPATPLTRFRIGSVSKALTSVALGLLVQEGKLDLDAPVQRYVPSFPVKRWPITTRELAGHLAGIRHYRDDEFANMRHYDSVLEGLAIFEYDTLPFQPGARFSYSSYGWNLVSAVIEGASGEPFLDFMTHRVFGPMGMVHTVPEFADSLIPWRARFYIHADSTSPPRNAPYVDNSYKWAGGGFLSTTEDLARFGRNLLDGRLLRPETLALLWTSQRTTDGKETGYGIGWYTGRDPAGRRRVGHTGGSMGGTAYLFLYPDQRLVVALLVNSDRTFLAAVPRIARRFLPGSD